MGSAEKIYDLEAGVNFRSRLARIERREKERERERKKKLSKSKNKIWRSPKSIASKRQSSINKQMVETSIARLGEEEGIPTRPKFSIAFLATVPSYTYFHVPRFLRGKKIHPEIFMGWKSETDINRPQHVSENDPGACQQNETPECLARESRPALKSL